MDAGPSCSKRDYVPDSDDEAPAQKIGRNETEGKESNLEANQSGSKQYPEAISITSIDRLSQITPNDVDTSVIPGTDTSRSGVIQKIHVENFMCHTSMEINLNSRVNFIVGRNGSGKSAILTALVIGLGGSAVTTNRGNSLKTFIKTGMNTATIEITLNNLGSRRYKPEEYGSQIIVTRKLNATSGSSGYKMKGSRGNIVSTKREELDRIINCFSLQVDNPISVLNQDTARSFLNSSNPHEKYELFMRATQLHLLWEIALKTRTAKRLASTLLKEKKAALDVTKKELDALELRWNQVKAIKGYRRKVANLRDELNWAVVIEEEKCLAALEIKREEQEARLPALLLEVESQAALEDRVNSKLQCVQGRIDELREEASKTEAVYVQSKMKAVRCKEAYIRKLQLYKVLCAKVQRHEMNVDSLRREIDKLQEGNECIEAEKQQQVKNQIANLEQQHCEMAATQKMLDYQLTQLRGQETKFKEEVQQHRAEQLEFSRRIDKTREQIASMQSNSSDKLSVYGSAMPVLVRKIEEACRQGKFTKKPVGPVGAYIQLRDASWAPAIESFLGGFLRSFCVDNFADAQALSQIFSSVFGSQRKPTIITSKFLEKVHDVRRFAVHSPPGMTSLLEALDISHPVVANCLIDQREIETILLIPTIAEACTLMCDKDVVPRNCKRAFTKEADQFYPDPDYRMYAGEINRNAQYLQVNMAEVISQKEVELKNCEQHKGELDRKLLKLNNALWANAEDMQQIRNEKSTLQRNLLRLVAEINVLKDSEGPEKTSIATLFAELKESSIQLQALKDEDKQLSEECDVLKKKMEEAKDETGALRETARILQSKELPLLAELENAQDEARELAAEKTYRVRKLHEQQEKLKLRTDRVEEQRKVKDKALDIAIKVCPKRIDTERLPIDLDREILCLEDVVASVERETGKYIDIGNELVERKERYFRVKTVIEEVGNALANLGRALDIRKDVYMQIQRHVSVRVNEMFSIMLREQKYKGRVKIDHQKQELIIEVYPNNRSTKSNDSKSLSGGERSYATVVFIMALWGVVNSPFYFLDEFDVFMDKVNRRVTLDMLTTEARAKKSCQFVFLTPQDLSSVTATSEVTIHRMEDPRAADCANIKK